MVEHEPQYDAFRSKAESCFFERDEEILSVRTFLELLPDKKKGLISVRGVPGSGKSRFLKEVESYAERLGYEVLSLKGKPALLHRSYGVLLTEMQKYDLIPSSSAPRSDYIQALMDILFASNKRGYAIIADDAHLFDSKTLDFLSHLLFSAYLSILTVIYTTQEDLSQKVPFLDAPHSKVFEMKPLSPAGFKLCLESILNWEPPADFVTFLYQQTSGLPAFLFKGVTYFTKQGILVKDDDSWKVNAEYTEIPLRAQIALVSDLPPHNLSGQVKPFIGRDTEIYELHKLLQNTNLLTLIGAPGVGRTSLARQVAFEILEDFPDGVFFVALDAVDSPEILYSTIAQALRITFYEREKPKEQLLQFCQDKIMLFIFSNFQIQGQYELFLKELLELSPRLKCIVTSSEPLNFRSEIVFELAGMMYPEDNKAKKLNQYHAFEFFINHAQRVNEVYRPSREELPHIMRLCQLVKGRPLALELLASMIMTTTCREMATAIVSPEVGRKADLEMSNLDPGMRVVLDYVWARLTDEEKQGYQVLALFQGYFSQDAAVRVTNGSNQLLTALTAKSLLKINEFGQYTLPPACRTFAWQKLAQNQQLQQETEDLFCTYYADFLQHVALYAKEQQSDIIEEMGREIDNIRLVWKLIIKRKKMEELKKCLPRLLWYFKARGLFSEGEKLLGWATDEFMGDQSRLQVYPCDQKTTIARIMAGLAWFKQSLGSFQQAQTLHQDSMKIFEECKDRKGQSISLNMLAFMAKDAGDYREAKDLFKQSLKISQELNDKPRIANSFLNIGFIDELLGNFSEADDLYTKSLTLEREFGNKIGCANNLNNLAYIASCLGKYQKALDLYDESYALYREIDHDTGMGTILTNRGELYLILKNYDDAEKQLLKGMLIWERVGNQEGKACCLHMLALHSLLNQKVEKAAQLADQSLAISQTNDFLWQETQTLKILGDIFLEREAPDQAYTWYRKALHRASVIQAWPLVLDTLTGIAELEIKNKNYYLALNIIITILFHRASYDHSKRKASQLKAALKSMLPPQEIQEAMEQGRTQELNTLVAQLL
ncbi:tetratricopeptide repeat protein [candidate division CSSED10-310 bacterium]|uniref:Tetratricopeptide repeat protein n=1 Tax=candidate division CSSED10-310 bacterium TaxID=2855610 RepID=A0ABV6YWT9_UNCC1